jgi:hypothetical protein
MKAIPFTVTSPLQAAQYTYEVLTDSTVADLRDRFRMDYGITPEYLFLGTQGNNDFNVIAERHGRLGAITGKNRGVTLSTFMGLHIVELPTLPDHVLLLGVLALTED